MVVVLFYFFVLLQDKLITLTKISVYFPISFIKGK